MEYADCAHAEPCPTYLRLWHVYRGNLGIAHSRDHEGRRQLPRGRGNVVNVLGFSSHLDNQTWQWIKMAVCENNIVWLSIYVMLTHNDNN